jgi:DNA polymerase III delta prime subunit
MEDVFVEEKRDGLDVSNLPPSVFGMTLADIEEYDRKQARNALRFYNAPVRDVTKETFWEFMSRPLPKEDEAEINEAMRAIAEVFD